MAFKSRISPMTAYKIRKVLMGHIQADESLVSNLQADSEAQLNLDQMLASLYVGDDLLRKVRELEALASCYQTLTVAGASHAQDILELEHQIVTIFKFASVSKSRLIPAEVIADSTADEFETVWLNQSYCRTVADILRVLNSFLQISSKYMGPTIALRIMINARPESDWICKFTLENESFFTFKGNVNNSVSEPDLVLIRDWIRRSIDFCTEILSNFRTLLDQDYPKI